MDGLQSQRNRIDELIYRVNVDREEGLDTAQCLGIRRRTRGRRRRKQRGEGDEEEAKVTEKSIRVTRDKQASKDGRRE